MISKCVTIAILPWTIIVPMSIRIECMEKNTNVGRANIKIIHTCMAKRIVVVAVALSDVLWNFISYYYCY